MTQTPRAGLPLLAAAQAQKHVTHNEALVVLDALTGLCILDRDLTEPPSGAAEGECWLVAAGATGDWADEDGQIACRIDGGWRFLSPFPGLVAYVADEARLLIRRAADWADVTTIVAFGDLEAIGIGTAADTDNPLSARLNSALLAARTVAEGGDGDLRLTFNKETAGDTASLIFQTGYSGRAEAGLLGSDGFAVKVSADGAAWTQALAIAPSTGAVTLGVALPVGSGGTGATTAPDALAGLGGLAKAGGTMTGPLEFSNGYVVVRLGAQFDPSDVGNGFRGGILLSAMESGGTTGEGQFGGSIAFAGINTNRRRAAITTVEGPDADQAGLVFFGRNATTTSSNLLNELFRVLYNGHVGLGTTTPTERLTVAGNVAPATDNARTLGSAALRWSTVHAASGTINTSDARQKQVRGRLSEAELAAWALVRPQVFRWLDAVALKGDDGARLHAGYVAQEVAEAFAACGLDPGRTGCSAPTRSPPSSGGRRPARCGARRCGARRGRWRRSRSAARCRCG
ncbi:DUF2793 domain-containing protein [Methylobrevis pamukkalensis]|uniref:Peptidase S74 domain-containing protein n=1 Tax=Methylobrevis pamukkalensis TaxID=1439726 RepID=A0A1E3H815_9HYPH|nr:DUF2793 domain-containing protein [Methylobrevis pamukkalensis]ODN72444.1 hypothetical protein A6302_00190 [Methylobrevis pamukkalensis]